MRRLLSCPIQKGPRNRRAMTASHNNSDAEIPVTKFDEEEESLPKKKRKRVLLHTMLLSVGSLAIEPSNQKKMKS